jgi:hypothetical protein
MLTMQNKIIRNKMFYVRHTVNKRYMRVEKKKLAMLTLTVLVILFPIKSELNRRYSSTYYIKNPHQNPLLTAIHAILVP